MQAPAALADFFFFIIKSYVSRIFPFCVLESLKQNLAEKTEDELHCTPQNCVDFYVSKTLSKEALSKCFKMKNPGNELFRFLINV